ncbi:MAG: UDP-N-acetylmuramate dehydrogenase [Coriobacteriia bacterium]|nr:UDP-N-acetylmuramate dehydrogenase [Coriobacteriia bacterium]
MPENLDKLTSILEDSNFDGDVFEMEPMSVHTTYKIGGPASFYIYVNSIEYLKKILAACKVANINWTIIGRGSNLLVSDHGYKGIVIMLGRDFKKFEYSDSVYTVGAAVGLSRIVNDAFRHTYSGFEFAVGTPGTIGGAIKMNAGTKTDWIGSRVLSVTLVDSNGEVVTKNGNDIDWDYRKSSIKDDEIVLFVDFNVTALSEDKEKYELKARMDGILERRRKSQPLNKPCCGSVFKNPSSHSAGMLIEEAGLKGCKCGDAEVSRKHANFIINRGRATATDVVTLLRHVQSEVYDIFDIKLYPEVKFLGFDEECSLW